MSNGKKIPLKDAKKYVEAYQPVELGTQEILNALSETQKKDPKMSKAVSHHAVKENAFLFDAELVYRFFDGSGPKADYLMVYLAADDQTFEPTVVVAGLKKKSGSTDEYVSLQMTEPASQHPPKYAVTTFHDTGKSIGGQMEVKILDKK